MKNIISFLTTCFAAYAAGALFGYFTEAYTIEDYTGLLLGVTKYVLMFWGAYTIGEAVCRDEE